MCAHQLYTANTDARDTAEAYAPNYSGQFIGLSGSEADRLCESIWELCGFEAISNIDSSWYAWVSVIEL